MDYNEFDFMNDGYDDQIEQRDNFDEYDAYSLGEAWQIKYYICYGINGESDKFSMLIPCSEMEKKILERLSDLQNGYSKDVQSRYYGIDVKDVYELEDFCERVEEYAKQDIFEKMSELTDDEAYHVRYDDYELVIDYGKVQ